MAPILGLELKASASDKGNDGISIFISREYIITKFDYGSSLRLSPLMKMWVPPPKDAAPIPLGTFALSKFVEDIY
jgi:hypothetical protein